MNRDALLVVVGRCSSAAGDRRLRDGGTRYQGNEQANLDGHDREQGKTGCDIHDAANASTSHGPSTRAYGVHATTERHRRTFQPVGRRGASERQTDCYRHQSGTVHVRTWRVYTNNYP